MNCDLVGFKRNFARKNWGGLFSHKGRELTDSEARKLVDYGISKGYRTCFDIPDAEIDAILGLDKEGK